MGSSVNRPERQDLRGTVSGLGFLPATPIHQGVPNRGVDGHEEATLRGVRCPRQSFTWYTVATAMGGTLRGWRPKQVAPTVPDAAYLFGH
jgi:hypothetical protein